MALQDKSVVFSQTDHWERAELVHESDDATAPCVYFINMDAHPFDISSVTNDLHLTIVSVFVNNWDNDLTPWPAPGLYRGEAPFRGYAEQSLQELTETVMPAFESAAGITPRSRAIAGYSLGGLFSLYSFTKDEHLEAAASMSGSVWYDGWVEYLKKWHENGPDYHDSRYVFLSLGDKERKAEPKRLHCVLDNTEATQQILEASGVKADFHRGPGNHYDHSLERVRLGLESLDRWYFGA